MLVDGRIAHLRGATQRDSGCLGCSATGPEWTEMHTAVAQESAKSPELGGSVVCRAVP